MILDFHRYLNTVIYVLGANFLKSRDKWNRKVICKSIQVIDLWIRTVINTQIYHYPGGKQKKSLVREEEEDEEGILSKFGFYRVRVISVDR